MRVSLGRNAQAIYQDLVEQFAFTSKYNSVKRFFRGLKTRDPERFDVLEFCRAKRRRSTTAKAR